MWPETPIGRENKTMAEYWQEKQLTPRHVIYAWALVIVVLAGVLVFEVLI